MYRLLCDFFVFEKKKYRFWIYWRKTLSSKK